MITSRMEYNDMNKLTNYIWKSLNIIRGEVPASDYDVILFLISAYKDKVMDFEEVIYPFALPQMLKSEIERDSRYS